MDQIILEPDSETHRCWELEQNVQMPRAGGGS